ncbi:hypothetical protein Pfo_004027 [Paulownia fortunei]|nr:hypothetical protein Pfo_004027 [Paulownia fortunei]
MESEHGLAAEEPLADDLKNEDLAHPSQIAKKTDIVDATDVLRLEMEYGSWVSSSEEEEVLEEYSKDPIREVLIQASVVEENSIAEYNDNINNEEGINPEKASIGAKARLLVGTEPDPRRETGVLQKLIRAPRYFDPPECSWPACNSYGENDDKGNKHKAKKRRKPCYICGDIGHEGKRCKKVNDCFICSEKGHLAIDCPNKNVEVDCTSRLCLICGSTGHDMFSCTNDYDSEDLKAIECYICKKVGHLCCVDNKIEGPREASCYNCGQSGHLGLECTQLNEVANDLQPLCSKCGDRGHYPRQCTKATSAKTVMEKDAAAAAAAKAAKRRARKARRWKKTKPTTTVKASQIQPTIGWRPKIVGPYYGKPGSNVWLSPAAAAARSSLNHQAGAIPSCQHISNQVGTQVLNSSDPLTRLPHLYWNSQNETQIPQLPLNQETGIMLPQTEIQIPQPMIQLPHITWDCQKGTQIPQPHHNHQIGILLPQTESQVPQNSSVLSAQLPHLI